MQRKDKANTKTGQIQKNMTDLDIEEVALFILKDKEKTNTKTEIKTKLTST